MDFIYVVGIAQAFFFALLLSRKREKSVADHILMAWLVFIGLHLLWFYWDYTGFTSKHPHLFGPNRFMPAAEGPFMWIYGQALLTGASKFQRKWLLHFLPFVLLNLLVIDIYLLPAQEKLEFMKVILPYELPWQAKIGNFFNLYSGPLYVILLLVQLRRFRRKMKDFFSFEEVHLRWLKRLAWGMAGIWVVVLGTGFYCTIMDTTLPDRNNAYIFTAVSAFVLFLGYHGLRYENILVKYSFDQRENGQGKTGSTLEKYQRSGLKPEQEKLLLASVVRLMEEKRLYREPNFTLDDLARELDTQRHYLSQAIGSEQGQTFFTLVNRYRVAEAQQKLASPDFAHYSFLGIGLECGFNSKASFNRVFKEYTGQTPSQYKQNLQLLAS